MTVTEALNTRRAIPKFDPSVSISPDELESLIRTASLAPSSMNLQPWKFLVVETQEDKERLKKVSYNQPKIVDASAVVVVLGDKHHFENAKLIVDRNIELGYTPADKRESFIERAAAGWASEQSQRDEAFRGSSLWSMAFMLAAIEQGWDTAPMGGYVAADLVAEFGLPEHLIPTLIICVGKRLPEFTLIERALRLEPSDTIIYSTP